MTNIILRSLGVKNFGPFANEVRFTTVSDRSKKEFVENTFSTADEAFNRISYIFGANGSGKSNFCKAIIQIQNLINLSPLLASNNPQLLELQPVKLSASEMDKHFLFDVSGKEIPTEYAIEIAMDGIIYNYSFSVHNGLILTEKLTKKKKRTETILLRTAPEYSSIEILEYIYEVRNGEEVTYVRGETMEDCEKKLKDVINKINMDKLSEFVSSGYVKKME